MVVLGILDQHLVRAHGAHAIVDAVSLTFRIALDAVKRRWMDHGTRRPTRRSFRWNRTNYLRRILAASAEPARCDFGFQTVFFRVVAGDDPRARDRIFA